MYQFEQVRATARKDFPFVVLYKHGKTYHQRYFLEEDAAKRWLSWAREITSIELPIGVILDIRQRTTPFLARKRTAGVRHRKYCETLHEAELWLASFSKT